MASWFRAAEELLVAVDRTAAAAAASTAVPGQSNASKEPSAGPGARPAGTGTGQSASSGRGGTTLGLLGVPSPVPRPGLKAVKKGVAGPGPEGAGDAATQHKAPEMRRHAPASGRKGVEAGVGAAGATPSASSTTGPAAGAASKDKGRKALEAPGEAGQGEERGTGSAVRGDSSTVTGNRSVGAAGRGGEGAVEEAAPASATSAGAEEGQSTGEARAGAQGVARGEGAGSQEKVHPGAPAEGAPGDGKGQLEGGVASIPAGLGASEGAPLPLTNGAQKGKDGDAGSPPENDQKEEEEAGGEDGEGEDAGQEEEEEAHEVQAEEVENGEAEEEEPESTEEQSAADDATAGVVEKKPTGASAGSGPPAGPGSALSGVAGVGVGALAGLTSVQRELEEARELLFGASTSGQSKEARLSKICNQLQQRLQEYKAENEQLEELLQQEREAREVTEEALAQAQAQLAEAKGETAAAEASVQMALSAKNEELEEVRLRLGQSQREAAELQGRLAALEASAQALARNRDMSEARVIQALREELAATEQRCEEERSAHARSRQEFGVRELELEQRVNESNAALMRMQRAMDDRSHRSAELEEKVTLLEAECSSLHSELQDTQAKLALSTLQRQQQQQQQQQQGQGGDAAHASGTALDSDTSEGKNGTPATDNVSLAAQIQAWREEADRARQTQRDAEKRVAEAKAEAQQLRVELEALKRQLDSSSATASNAELERRFIELTELLCSKQAQLEAMASEKQAAQLQVEKQARELKDAKMQVERDRMALLSLRNSGTGRGLGSSASGLDLEDSTMEMGSFMLPGLHQRRSLGKGIQQAAKLLDRGTVTAGRFLGRHPLARLGLLFYLVFVHLFLMHLIHRLQEQADSCLARDQVAQAAEAAAGLVKPAKLLLLRRL